MKRQTQKSINELLHADHYTPQELAELLGLSEHIVQNAAFEGELPAQIVGHHIVSIRCEDVVDWFNTRYGPTRAVPPGNRE